MEKIKVMLIDDHALVREGIKALLGKRPEMEVIAESETGKDALAQMKSKRPDVCVIDISLQDMNGLDLIPLIRQAIPMIKIVMLSMHKKDFYVHKALRAGAIGYVLKTSDPKDLITAITNAAKSTFFLSPEINSRVINLFLSNTGNETETITTNKTTALTEREQQILCLMLEGNTTREIAEFLYLSPKTIEKHRANIYKKSGNHDPFSLMKYAVKNELIDLEIWL